MQKMTSAEKEHIQYLLTQLLEDKLSEKESKFLFNVLDREQTNTEVEGIIQELIASESKQPDYDPEHWRKVIDNILRPVEGGGELAETTTEGAKIVRMSNRRKWLWAASVAAVFFLIASIWLFNTGGGNKEIATNYGEQKNISLSDDTEIILNANSTINYAKTWKKGQPREVWLKGEALFNVKHLNSDTTAIKEDERFIVHTDLVNVEVLGTVFNVRERRNKTEIVLQEGKVKISFNTGEQADIVMKPGQQVIVTGESKKAVVTTTEPEDYTAWTKNKMVLTNASFKQIVEYIEDNLGKKVILTDPRLADRKVEGTFQIDNLDDALLVLSKGLNVDIIQKGDTLTISPK